MMQAAPAAPSAPAMVAVTRPVLLKFDRLPCDAERDDRDDDADQEVGGADAEQGLERVAKLGLAQVQQCAIGAPRQHGARHEDDPAHSFLPRWCRSWCA